MSRIYFYSHDALGLGHFRRNLNVAFEAVHKMRDVTCLLLTGSPVPGVFRLPMRTDFVKLPSLVKMPTGAYESALAFETGAETAALRGEIIKTVIRERPPDILYVDKHADGLRGELLPALRWIKKHVPTCRVFLGLRDVLDDPEVARREWVAEKTDDIVDRFYHRVCICGDERVYPTADAYGFADGVRHKMKYVGYVVPRVRPHSGSVHAHHIVAAVGGGADGDHVLRTVVAAVAMLRRGMPVTASVYTGPLMQRASFRALRAMAAPFSSYVKVERFSRDYLREVASAGVVVTMGGYNSLVETVYLGRPAVIVPRVAPRREQMIRARAFEQAGLVRVLDPEDLSPRVMAEAIERELTGARVARAAQDIDFGGASAITRSLRHTLKTGTVADL